MTAEQLQWLLDRYGLPVVALVLLTLWLWRQGWPWLKDRIAKDDAAREARDKREQETAAAHRAEIMRMYAEHRADLSAMLAENNAYRKQRIETDGQMADAINGITEMVKSYGVLDKINERLGRLESERKGDDAQSIGNRR